MAILFSQADGSDQHYDTYEEFEKALILIKRLNGEKVPQDLLDEVRDKYDGKDPKTYQVEIDGPQDLEALGKAIEAFFKGIDDTEEDVNMEKLPIGTLVKVVGNRAGHCHEVGEILPITEVDEGSLNGLYRLAGRRGGWVAVKDIEFVSFPEEDDSTSGDEGLTVDNLQEGDSVKFLVDHTDVYGDTVQKGRCAEVIVIQDGDILLGTSPSQSVKNEDIPTVLTKIDEDEEPTSGNEEDSDLGFKNGDYAKVLESNVIFDCGDVVKILGVEGDGHPLAEREDGVDGYAIASQLMKIDKPSGNIDEEEDESEIKAGDIVIATEDEFDITEGSEYEIREDEDGDLYFLDDNGDIRFVLNHEDRLRKKSTKRGFKRGDVVYVNEEITDSSGDSIYPGVITEFVLDSGVQTPDGTYVVVEDGDIGKLTLVCRAEDRLDK